MVIRFLYLGAVLQTVVLVPILATLIETWAVDLLLAQALVVAAAVLIGMIWLMRRWPIRIRRAEDARFAYVARAFGLLAFAYFIPMLGFVMVFLSADGGGGVYPLSLVLAVPGFFLAAPSSRDLAQLQGRIGSDVDLVGAMIRTRSS